jgi:lipopolysaccharide export system permease protein
LTGRLSMAVLLLGTALLASGSTNRGTVERVLDNGLKVVVREDRRAPVVVSMVWYRVGSIDEVNGLTGLAHVTEHMMFRGTRRLPDGEFSRRVAQIGGRDNAFTGRDYTAYHQQLSAKDLGTVLELEAERMATLDLFRYIQHLNSNNQSSQRYEIEFWIKIFYPLSCLVMLTLALPFAYLHFRSGNIAGYVFGGVMAGISFYLLNNVFGFMGNLQNWQPWLTAAAPAMIYSIVSLATFGWLVLRQ